MSDDDLDQPIFLPLNAWHRLGDWLSEHETFARQLGIECNVSTGTITETEIACFLGGQCNVWPEWAMKTILAETLSSEEFALSAPRQQPS